MMLIPVIEKFVLVFLNISNIYCPMHILAECMARIDERSISLGQTDGECILGSPATLGDGNLLNVLSVVASQGARG